MLLSNVRYEGVKSDWTRTRTLQRLSIQIFQIDSYLKKVKRFQLILFFKSTFFKKLESISVPSKERFDFSMCQAMHSTKRITKSNKIYIKNQLRLQ